MAILYRIDPGQRLVEMHISGEINVAEVEENLGRLIADPAYRPEYNALVDLSESPTLFTSEQIRSLADYVRHRMPMASSRRAVVVKTDVAFGLIRMYEAFTEDLPRSFRVFRSLKDAQEWLGLLDRSAKAH